MVLKLPRDLLQFVDSHCDGESYQTFIIKVLREKQISLNGSVDSGSIPEDTTCPD